MQMWTPWKKEKCKDWNTTSMMKKCNIVERKMYLMGLIADQWYNNRNYESLKHTEKKMKKLYIVWSNIKWCNKCVEFQKYG
jgi:hypothetical protein